MNFASYQSRGQLEAPYQHYTKPANLQVDNSGERMLARANADTAKVIVEGFNNWREQYDQGKVMEANNEYNRLMSEGTAELMQKKQENALNVVEDYDKLHAKSLEKVRKKYGQFINYGKAGQAFNIYTERDNNTRREHMMKYQMAETDAYHETQFNNQLATCIQTAADGGYTDMSIDQGLNRAEGFIEARYGQYGKEMVEQQKRIFKGQIVADALSLSMKMEDYARMGQLAVKYSDYLDPKTRVSVLSMLGKRQKDAHDFRQANDLWVQLGGENATLDDYRNYFSNLYANNGNATTRFSHYDSRLGLTMPDGRNGCVEAVVALTKPFAKLTADNSDVVNCGVLCRLAQNSDSATIERYNGGKVNEGDVLVYFSEGDDISDFDNAEHVVMADGNGGYYGNSSSAKDYVDENGNEVRGDGCIIHSDDQEIGGYQIGYVIRMDRQTMQEMSDLEVEEQAQKAWALRNKRISEIKAMENQWIEQYSLKQQDLLNQGVENPDAYDALALEAWQASGYSDRVRITLEKQGGHLRNIQSKAAERAAARESGTGGSGGSSGGIGKKTDDPFFKTKLEVMLRNGMSREQAYQLIEETNPKDATSAVNLVNDYFAGKEKYSVDFDDYKQRIADVCEVNKSDGDFNILYEQATDYAYELIMQYRDEHGGKDPTSAQITDYLIDGVTKTRIDTGERSWFGFGSPEYKESPLTPAEWFNRGVYNDPAEDYDADRGVYVVKTRRGTFTATEEQYQRIVDGEDADIVLSR